MGKPKARRLQVSNNQQNTPVFRTKRTKTVLKKIKRKNKIKFKQYQSMKNILSKMQTSSNKSSHDDSCIVVEDSKSIQDLTNNGTVLFIEDRTGDESIQQFIKEVSNMPSPNRRKKRPHILDHTTKFSLRKKLKTTSQALKFPMMSTPNKSQNVLDISSISSVHSPSVSKDSFSQQIGKLKKEMQTTEYATIDLTGYSSASPKTVIDLTHRSRKCSRRSVIDLDKEDGECSITGVSEPEVTVVSAQEFNQNKLSEKQIAEGIAKMNSSEKGRLLEMITGKILSGCNTKHIGKKPSAEDTYIQEMISGSIRHSAGGNVYHPSSVQTKTGLRMIVIDGSNVAMQHGSKKNFSVKGLKICIDYFLKRGHIVKAFVPHWRSQAGKSSDPALLCFLEERGHVVYTPSRRLNDGRCVSSYDDRFIIQCAVEFDAVIVSQDRYRDLAEENPKWRSTIDARVLQYTWVQDMIMFPQDPLGKSGPTLEQFLRHD